MDAPDADADVKLRKLSAHLIADIDGAVGGLVRRRRTSRHAHGRVRARMEMATTTIDMFLELPQLLDPHLPTWIPLLADAYLACCRSPKVPSQPAAVPLAHALCRLLYALCKVRGEKVVVRFLPVDVRCLEVLLGAMEAAEAPTSFDDDDGWRWEQRYVVLLWLSHLLLAPFDLATISSADVDDDALSSVDAFVWPRNLPSISARLTPLAMRYLAMPGKEHDAARALLVRLALRRDMQRLGLLDALVDWALAWLQPNSSMGTRTTWFYLGLLSFLGGLLTSTGETSDMDAHLPIIFRTVHRLTLKEDDLSRTLTSLAPARKTMLKVMRCVAVSFLRRPSAATTDVVETTIGHFLESLADNDTPVRLAASKALSVVTLRLAPAMAEQVVDAVLDSLDRNVVRTQHGDRHLSGVDPLEWHGLMLTLSHLLFRRSPPATQLAPILRALILGLSFEKRSTAGGSVGANVRDAACFGIWAAARRYTTRELLLVPAPADGDSMLQLLATELVVTASLDPAGNIRRGASAALQELIGRHPDVMQQGIAVVQTVDYHAVARRSRAVADVAVAAARLSPGYADALVHGILGWRGIGDSHAPWRRAAAAVFGLLAAEQSDGSRGTGRLRPLETCARRLTQLIKALAKRQVQELHGSLLCLASVLDQAVPRLCRSKTAQQQDDGDASTWTVTAWMHEMLSAASDLLLLADCRDRKPELVAEGAARLAVALCPLVQAKAQPQAQLRTGAELLSPSRNGHRELNSAWDAAPPTDADVSGFLSRLRGAMPVWLSHNEPETVGWTSLAALMLLVFSSAEERDHLLQAWADVARRKPAKRGATAGCGYFRALGLALPLADKVQDGGEAICEALVARWQAEDDIDTKVALLASIISSRALEARPERFIGLLKQGLGDYTTNARGDVGSHVRVEALRALRALWERSREDNDDDDDDDDDDDPDDDTLSFPEPPQLPSPQEDIIPFTISTTLLLKSLWSEYASPIINPLLRLLRLESAPCWHGSPIDYSLPHRTRLLPLLLDARQAEALLHGCRAKKTTLTALLHALLLTSFLQRLPPHSHSALTAATPISLRPFITDPDVNLNLLRCLVSSHRHDFSLKDMTAITTSTTNRERESAIWSAAHSIRTSLTAQLAKTPSDDPVAMLAWVTDWLAFWAARHGKPRQDSWEISNAGLLLTRQPRLCSLSRLSFANGPMVAGPPVGLGVASVAAGDLSILVSWQEGVVEAELMRGLVDDLRAWTIRFSERGTFFAES